MLLEVAGWAYGVAASRGCGPGQGAGAGLFKGPAGSLFDLVVVAAERRKSLRIHHVFSGWGQVPRLVT